MYRQYRIFKLCACVLYVHVLKSLHIGIMQVSYVYTHNAIYAILCKLYKLYTCTVSVHTHNNASYTNYTLYIQSAIQNIQVRQIIQCTCTYTHTHNAIYAILCKLYKLYTCTVSVHTHNNASYTNYTLYIQSAIQNIQVRQIIQCTCTYTHTQCNLCNFMQVIQIIYMYRECT